MMMTGFRRRGGGARRVLRLFDWLFVDDDERATRESCYLPTNGPVLAYLIYLSKKETLPSPRPPRFGYSFIPP